MSVLLRDLRKSHNLFSAWKHVKRSAQASASPEVRGDAAVFAHRDHSELRSIYGKLNSGKYSFSPVRGVLKDKNAREALGKSPRPLVVGRVSDRVVQRALLQVLQPRRILDPKAKFPKYEMVFDERLGKINHVSRSKIGIGGLLRPYGGVNVGVRSAMQFMANGRQVYFQSDIKAFFTKIPVPRVKEFIEAETRDHELACFFEEAVQVELSNPSQLAGYTEIFPKGGLGVPQGSSLSAFAGNILLFEFDKQLSLMGVDVIRYIDDLFILADNYRSLDAAVRYAQETLSEMGLSLYEDESKCAKGKCADGFLFLGCDIQPNKCVPSSRSVKNLLADVDNTLSSAKADIGCFLSKRANLAADSTQSGAIARVGRQVYGWERAFKFCNQIDQFRRVDEEIAKKIHDFLGWVSRKTTGLTPKDRMVVWGVPSAADLHIAG
ncbi:MAG: reverse transcriptase domain-containing protein [Amaricoccus sp.]